LRCPLKERTHRIQQKVQKSSEIITTTYHQLGPTGEKALFYCMNIIPVQNYKAAGRETKDLSA
jgi:hypothetical protein